MRFFYTDILIIYQRRRFLLLSTLILGHLFLPCNALSSGLLIVYPKVKAPYNKIYQDIIKGIDESYPGTSQKLMLLTNSGRNVLVEKIEQHQPDVLVTLGKRALEKVRQLKPSIPVVAGVITKTEEVVSGVSMTPDPEVILSYLLTMAPYVQRVYVVSDLERQAQLQSADAYLSERSKILQIEEAGSVQEAADKYLKIIHQASAKDAIWLMRGASIDDPSILMLVLKAAWKKRIVVFSSNPSHVKRGALFSLYPDNKKLGYALTKIAQQHEQGLVAPNTDLTPLRSVHLIVNRRTSKHLGITPHNISGLTVHRLL